MKRDAIVLEEPAAPYAQATTAIRRTPRYFPSGAGQLFGWYHDCPQAARTNAVAVICPPAGSEYTRSHRSLRHLADGLAAAGIPALRFDYAGVGDSPGSDLDPDRIGAWRSGILAAIAHARESSGCTRVHLIGVRLGATLAALAAEEAPVDRMVLWNPCVKGASYARELRALALAAQRQTCELEGALESAGFVTTAETLAALAAIDLRRATPRVRDRVLVLGRDDAAVDATFNQRLDALGIANEHRAAPGWAGMMAEHQFTVVPDAALALVVDWLREPCREEPGLTSQRPVAMEPQERVEFDFETEEGHRVCLEEHLCRFGAEGHLFGVLTRPRDAQDAPAIVVFNAGAAHHVGPNRLYVELTRNLAALGFACLRFDLESLGDSVNRVPARENYPYPGHAVADGHAAMQFLRREHGCQRFIALGLCSGAHTVFHAGLELAHEPIEEIIMVNPMQFYWVEGMSLDTSRKFEDMVQYKRSMRDPKRWLKLARGDVNFGRMVEVVGSQVRTQARAWLEMVREALVPDRGPRLARDLRKLFAMRRRLTLFVSEGDPGRDILLAGARLTAKRALRDGRIRLQMIPEADHTFSQWKPRRDLLRRLTAHLRDAAPSYKRNGSV